MNSKIKKNEAILNSTKMQYYTIQGAKAHLMNSVSKSLQNDFLKKQTSGLSWSPLGGNSKAREPLQGRPSQVPSNPPGKPNDWEYSTDIVRNVHIHRGLLC